jgi:hypothetical protein
MCLGFFNVIISANHAMFPWNLEITKPVIGKAFIRILCFLSAIFGEELKNNS